MLTATEIDRFNTEGFLVVADVLGEDILAPLRSEYHDLMNRIYSEWEEQGLVPPGPDMDFWDKLLTAYQARCDWFQPMDIALPDGPLRADTPFHIGPAVFDLLTSPAILDIVQDLIGPEITSNPIQHVRLKPPAAQLQADEVRAHVGGTDWHQDRGVALASADDTQMITVWVAVNDATLENGCLTVIPKTADQEMLPHCPKTQTAIADGFVNEDAAVPTPVGAGGVVLIHPLTPHAALPNRSGGFRWSFDLRYHVTGQSSGRDHFPSFVARSSVDPSSELRDWRTLHHMWDETRARIAATAHTPLHRWSGDAPYCA
ncbi:MAG: phytanoyl-CoA dioxygenase family protein [Pseudomonadota bacterium]